MARWGWVYQGLCAYRMLYRPMCNRQLTLPKSWTANRLVAVTWMMIWMKIHDGLSKFSTIQSRLVLLREAHSFPYSCNYHYLTAAQQHWAEWIWGYPWGTLLAPTFPCHVLTPSIGPLGKLTGWSTSKPEIFLLLLLSWLDHSQHPARSHWGSACTTLSVRGNLQCPWLPHLLHHAAPS